MWLKLGFAIHMKPFGVDNLGGKNNAIFIYLFPSMHGEGEMAWAVSERGDTCSWL